MIGVSWCLVGLIALVVGQKAVSLNADIPCIPNQKIASPETCDTYYICYNGKVMEQVCSEGSFFDKSISDCSSGKCSCEIKENDRDCSHYNVTCVYEKKWGFGSSREERNNGCPNGKLFDGILKKCVNMSEARCGPAHCIDGEIRGDLFSSNYYSVCDKGHWNSQECSPFHRFDPVKQQCTTACSAEPITVNTKHCTSGGRTCGWQRIFDSNTKLWSFNWQCVPSEEASDACAPLGPVIDSSDCQLYWSGNQCGNHSFWYQDSCFFFRRFNNITQGCEFSWNCVQTKYSQHNHWGQRKISEDDCQSYWEGYSNGWVLESCWYFRRFNNDTGSCQWGLNCVNPVTPTQAPTTAETPTTPSPCTLGETRINSQDCQKYSLCENNQWVDQQCNETSKFNPNSDQCEVSDVCFTE